MKTQGVCKGEIQLVVAGGGGGVGGVCGGDIRYDTGVTL